MSEEIKALINKPYNSYDVNRDGKIKGEEVQLFKNDCKKLFAHAYGEDSKQYKNLVATLDKTQISFMKQNTTATTQFNDYKNRKYNMSFALNGGNVKFKDNTAPIAYFAGVLVHEAEHIQQNQKIYDKVAFKEKRTKENSKTYPGNEEVFAEIERMNFYKKVGLEIPQRNPAFWTYEKALGNQNIDPSANRAEFFEKFDYKLFEQEVKSRYPYLKFNSEVDPEGFKELVGE